MTTERAFIVGLDAADDVLGLVDDIWSAARRADKADPGDRTDIVRYEALCAQLEHIAATSSAPRTEIPAETAARVSLIGRDQDRWDADLPAEVRAPAAAVVNQGLVPVVVLDPLVPGAREERHDSGLVVPAPAARWPNPEGAAGRRAVEARFRSQIYEALDSSTDGSAPRPIAPSGVQNAVVTEILREFVAAHVDTARVDVPVEYRDGSRSAHRIALRSLELKPHPVGGTKVDLHFALLSIRHTEMDAVVHGTWLRNAEVSRPRPAAQTDDLVYDMTRTQLLELTSNGTERIRLHLYQTGLETAVVGFYKALVDHLLEHTGTVAVQPMYFQQPPRRKKGQRPGGGRNGSRPDERKRGQVPRNSQPEAAPVKSAPFKKGTPWQT